MLRSLADAGSADAQYQLALKYDLGNSVERNPSLAAKWYRRAAEQEHLAALQALGIMYLQGRGQDLPRRTEVGLELLRLAAYMGWRCTPSVLGFYLTMGLFDIPQDFREGMKWFRIGAELKDDFAQQQLADLHAGGLGAPVDHVEAMKWVIIAEHNPSSNRRRNSEIRDGLLPLMSPEQIAEAERRAKDWLARHGK